MSGDERLPSAPALETAASIPLSSSSPPTKLSFLLEGLGGSNRMVSEKEGNQGSAVDQECSGGGVEGLKGGSLGWRRVAGKC